MKRKLLLLLSMFAIVAIAFTSCQKDQLIDQKDEVAALSTPSTPVSDGDVTPFIIEEDGPGGNVTCDMLDGNFALSTGKFNYDAETGEWEDDDEVIYENFPYEGITVEYDPETKTLSFTANVPGYCVGAVIVKGGPSANIYFYPEGISSDSGLGAPGNADLSNLTFCLIECEDEECYEFYDETAWAGIAGPGSAWWFIIDTTLDGPYQIYAGQKLVEGAFVNIESGMLTIDFGDYLTLQDVSEPIKIQGYNTIPNRRPAAGGFTTYKGDFPADGVNVAGFRYVAVHLDAKVKVLVDCPEGE
jgi:hypothetical protein